MNVLFIASESFPLVKTGGLADVVHGLSDALQKMGNDVRLVLPAYRELMASVYSIKEIYRTDVVGLAGISREARILEAHADGCCDMLYLVDVPDLFDRPGNPYVDLNGTGWSDNAERFTIFSRVAAELAVGQKEIGWQPDVVHCHDWQTGMVPVFLSASDTSLRTVFTIHNLSYDGAFTYKEFANLGLPEIWWSSEYLEFYGNGSMIKAGMIFSDEVTTVSPTYAREICTPEYGYQYAGVLQHISDKLSGILNGIDQDVWNPKTDNHLKENYSVRYRRQAGKQANKKHLLKRAELPVSQVPLLGFVGRLVEQKGVDLIASILPRLFAETDAAVVILGSGDSDIETRLKDLSAEFHRRLHVYIGYSEDLAHMIEAGSDMFLMPSRFEPCGLNQMYSLRYGTPPIVNDTGGLADTVVDTSLDTINNKTANGFVIRNLEAASLLATIKRALSIFRKPRLWSQICRSGMELELGWESSARQYQKLYQN